jgi:hypothetical protein
LTIKRNKFANSSLIDIVISGNKNVIKKGEGKVLKLCNISTRYLERKNKSNTRSNRATGAVSKLSEINRAIY